MKVFNDVAQLSTLPNSVLTIGTFDGVHVGHQKILKKINEEAKSIHGESILFTFYPHPRMVLFPENHGVKLIQTQEEKLKKLDKFQLENIVVIPFTKDFSNLTAYDFVKDFLIDKFKIKKLVIGYDHQFGKNREGDIHFLKNMSKEFDFEVIEITAEEINEVNVSSTKIRQAIIDGDIETANLYLNDCYELNGTVVKGNQLGRKIGFPTANISAIPDEKLLPKVGVYFVEVEIDNTNYKGMLNIGYRPTVDESKKITIEVNIFDFSKDIYSKLINVKFISKIRDEIKFDSIDKLIYQLEKDEKYCRNLINNL